MFRKMLEEQPRVMEDGGDPINVMRTEHQRAYIPLPIADCCYPEGFAPDVQDTRTGVIDEVKDLKAVPA
jgi:hypothetical protein